MPLALELAAAQTRALAVGQIAARLDESFRLLVGGSRTAPSRQQTLEVTLDWSYDLLSRAEQMLPRRLSVFAGGFDLRAAHRVDRYMVLAGHRQKRYGVTLCRLGDAGLQGAVSLYGCPDVAGANVIETLFGVWAMWLAAAGRIRHVICSDSCTAAATERC
jgi:hypothetical protein